MAVLNYVLASFPLFLPGLFLIDLLDDPNVIFQRWSGWIVSKLQAQDGGDGGPSSANVLTVSSQLLAYLVMGVFGFILTNKLIPNIQEYTLRKGICGKDLGKRGTPLAEKPV